MTWGTAMKFSRCDLNNIKSHKKSRLHLLSRRNIFWKATGVEVKLTLIAQPFKR